MIMYRAIGPEVAGGLGEQTIMKTNVHPPVVEKLHYEFDSWLGDDILESFPCFLVSERLKNSIVFENLTGVAFDDVLISESDLFRQIHPDLELPVLFWAKIDGERGIDDFVIGDDHRLLISEKAYTLLQFFHIDHAFIGKTQASRFDDRE